MGQLDVETSELRSAAKKIKDSVDKSDSLKLKELGDSGDDFGHGDAAEAFSQLMGTWAEAIKSPLKEDGEQSAEKLKQNAESYDRSEQLSRNHFTGPSVVGPGPIY